MLGHVLTKNKQAEMHISNVVFLFLDNGAKILMTHSAVKGA